MLLRRSLRCQPAIVTVQIRKPDRLGAFGQFGNRIALMERDVLDQSIPFQDVAGDTDVVRVQLVTVQVTTYRHGDCGEHECAASVHLIATVAAGFNQVLCPLVNDGFGCQHERVHPWRRHARKLSDDVLQCRAWITKDPAGIQIQVSRSHFGGLEQATNPGQ